MKNLIPVIFGITLLFMACKQEQTRTTSVLLNKMEITPPTANKNPKELTIHNDTRVDDYYWLNNREDQEVINYLESENAYTTSMLSHTEDFQKTLFDEIIGRIKQTDMSVPYKDNGFFYITRYEEGKEHPIHSRKAGSLDGDEDIMLDVNQMAEAYSFYQIGGRSVSMDNKILAFGEDTLSRRIYSIRFKNLETGTYMEDVLTNTTGRAVWANDNQTLFYTRKDDALRSYKIFKHKLGTDQATDEEVFHEADETFSTFVYKSKSDKYIIIGSYATLSSEFRFVPADRPDETFKIFQPRERELEYSIAHYNDKFYVLTNLDAKNFRLMETRETQTSKDHWKEVIAHRPEVLLEDMDIFKDYLVLSERINGIRKLRIMPWGGSDHYIDFGEEAYTAYTSINLDFDTELLRIGYTSLTTPNTTYDYNMKTKERILLKQQEVVGDFDPANYTSERIYADAKDGTKVPVSIVYRKEFKKDGEQPLLLYGYGSYGASMNPGFNSNRLSLLDRGFAFAIAHIRGGQEMGRQWYEDGKLLKKINTFTDFIDCAQFLVDQKYTNPDQLFAIGGSAGGLLMGAVANLAPELFKGIIAAVPFVDVVTTMLDESIPLTTGEYDEWGNPNDPAYYAYMKSYSPYDNVEAKDYPAMLVTTGLHDSQVQYWEPAKWVAKLRELKTDRNPLLLHTNMDTGHSGASGRFERHKETALEYAFLLDLAGKADLAD
jgi:oligopeptidase B